MTQKDFVVSVSWSFYRLCVHMSVMKVIDAHFEKLNLVKNIPRNKKLLTVSFS